MRIATRLAGLAAALALVGCGVLKPDAKQDAASGTTQGASESRSAQAEPQHQITVQTPAVRAYRKVGAGAIYKKYPQRIYKGKIPPLVYAVVVTETEVDATGRVTAVNFSRTPSHAPEVSGMIADLIKGASPLPNPGKVGAHTYVDTWLWDKSGKFQLDTLTLGQRNR